MRVCVVIATLNRSDDLRRMLASLVVQSCLPAQVVVVDQSDDRRTENVFNEFALNSPAIQWNYVKSSEKSLVKARNLGLSYAKEDIVSFFDDDVDLEPLYLAEIVACFERKPEVAGLSGNTTNIVEPSGLKWSIRKFMLRFFLINQLNGKLTPSGLGTPICHKVIDSISIVEMLAGCNMNYRRASLEGERFDEWFQGYSFREDAEFSYRISKKGTLLMLPSAKLKHYYSPANRLRIGSLKEMEVRNYHYVFKKLVRRGFMDDVAFVYSMSGFLLIYLTEALTNRDGTKWSQLAGFWNGFRRMLFRGSQALHG